FTQKNNGPANALSVAPLSGDHLIIELNIPTEITEYGSLQLSRVYHDVLNIFGTHEQSSSKTCDENINCENGTFWQTEKRAVCKIISDGLLSTGTLIANTSKNNQTYLITSQHTMFSDEKAIEAIFV